MSDQSLPVQVAQAEKDARAALAEDIGGGDLSAPLLPEKEVEARLYCRERGRAVLCGIPWFEACFRALAEAPRFDWEYAEGAWLTAGEVCRIVAPARAVFAAERSAINFLQTLSATATAARFWQDKVGKEVEIVDTRKTLPMLRAAQKYAVRVGGAKNHRFGLYDEILIKENHISVGGGIPAVLRAAAKLAPPEKIQIEVQTLEELQTAIAHGATRVLLDNFSIPMLRRAVATAPAQVELEASGGINEETVMAVAATGVRRISIGALTKSLRAIDFSLLAS